SGTAARRAARPDRRDREPPRDGGAERGCDLRAGRRPDRGPGPARRARGARRAVRRSAAPPDPGGLDRGGRPAGRRAGGGRVGPAACPRPRNPLGFAVTLIAIAPILLVEDDPLLRGAFRMLLENAGYAVREAGTAREALDAVAEGSPSLI